MALNIKSSNSNLVYLSSAKNFSQYLKSATASLWTVRRKKFQPNFLLFDENVHSLGLFPSFDN